MIKQYINDIIIVFAKTKGTLIIESGKIYFTLLFEPFCVFAGIYPIEKEKDNEGRNFLSKLDFWRLWTDYCDPHSNFPGPIIDAGFYVNMNSKLLILFDNKKNKEIHRINFPSDWTKVCPAVNFKHVVSITISSDAVRGKPDFIKI